MRLSHFPGQRFLPSDWRHKKCLQSSAGYLDGFSFTAPRRYDPRFFGYDIIRRPRSGDDLGHFLEGVFLLYKLHGSVNWARNADKTIYGSSGDRVGGLGTFRNSQATQRI